MPGATQTIDEELRVVRSRLGYSPALDGVRGLFMLCFMAYHFGVDQLAGMWVCINLFFVLSAFLITRLLVEERVQRGDIDVWGFYRRRARRLLPGLFLVLTFVLVYAVLWADAADLAAATCWPRSATS